jgi:thioesterase domain-containing protein
MTMTIRPLPFLTDAQAPKRLETYLRAAIPVVNFMDVRVLSCDVRGVVLEAPLAPNRNHIGTAFGASLHGLATLAAWGLVWLTLEDKVEREIVVAASSMRYRAPAPSTFQARCALPDAQQLWALRDDYMNRKRARIVLTASIECAGERVADFEGTFVALKGKPKV